MGVTWQQSISHDHKFGILFDVLKGFFISFSDFWCHFVQFLSVLNDVHCSSMILSGSSTCNTSFILFDVFSNYPSVQSFLQLVSSVSETLIGVTRPRSVLTIVTLFFSFTDFHRITHVSKDTVFFSSVAPKTQKCRKNFLWNTVHRKNHD